MRRLRDASEMHPCRLGMFSWEVSLQTIWSISQLKNIVASTQKTLGRELLRNGIASKRMRALKYSAIY